jgi:hypothetical protein
MNTKDLISNSHRKNCFAIVLRHSIREEITDARNSQNQLLTEEGKNLAMTFGAELPTSKPLRIYHSNIKRCEETAFSIKQGFNGLVSEVSTNNTLMGFFMLKPDAILQDVNSIGGYKFINKWFNEHYPENQIMRALTARKQMVDFIKKNYNEKYLDLYITHDWNVILLLSYHYKLIENNYPWPSFMNGVCLQFSDNEFSVICESNNEVTLA